jgi:hypothetical protein
MNDIQAFPMAVPENWASYQDGMTLRDYFAGQIINGLLSGNGSGGSLRELSDRAYIFADIMLEARGE